MPPVITISNLSKRYTNPNDSTLSALEDVNLTIEEKSFVTLIGPSGCGKTTLLNITGGLVQPTTGDVIVDGVKVTSPQPDKVAVVFQEASLFPWRSVLKNVEFGLEIRGIPVNERRPSALKYIELVGLKGFENYFPSQLSGGMQQRVNVARALVLEPKVLLMDEPFGALDEQSRLALGKDLIDVWRKTEKTIVFVTHSLTEAAYLSEDIVVMSARPGRIVEVLRVDVPHPRNPESMRLAEIRRRLWELISTQKEMLHD